MMRLALVEARKCDPVPTGFCVGCVLAVPSGDRLEILSSGYSRELSGNTHAEANALTKARKLAADAASGSHMDIEGLLSQCTIYTTMEPCSIRTSGLSPCSDAIIAAGIRRCVIGVKEPDDFVTCEGAHKLQTAGVEVNWLQGFEMECLDIARGISHNLKISYSTLLSK